VQHKPRKQILQAAKAARKAQQLIASFTSTYTHSPTISLPSVHGGKGRGVMVSVLAGSKSVLLGGEDLSYDTLLTNAAQGSWVAHRGPLLHNRSRSHVCHPIILCVFSRE